MNLLADRVYKSELEAQLSPLSCKRNRTTLDFLPNFWFFVFFLVKLNTGDELCGSVCSLFFALMCSWPAPVSRRQTHRQLGFTMTAKSAQGSMRHQSTAAAAFMKPGVTQSAGSDRLIT